MASQNFDYEDEIKAHWKENLIRFPKSIFIPYNLEQKDNDLLTLVGLPNLEKDAFKFNKDSIEFEIIKHRGNSFIKLGCFNSPYPFGIEIKTRRLFFLDDPYQSNFEPSQSDFLNSNLESLLLFLVRMDKHYYKVPNNEEWGEKEMSVAVDIIEKQLIEIDPTAIVDEELFWAGMLREMRLGLV